MKRILSILLAFVLFLTVPGMARGDNITTFFRVGQPVIVFENGNATIETPVGVTSSYYLQVEAQNTTGFISYTLKGPFWMSVQRLNPSITFNPPLNLTFNGANYGTYVANITAQDQLNDRAWTDVVDVVVMPQQPQQPSPKPSGIGIDIITLLGIAAAAIVVFGTVIYVYDGSRAEVKWSERWTR